MRCLRIHATPDGESHFDEVELPTTRRSVHPEAASFEVTASYPASRVRITRIPAGSFVLVADTHGKGHLSRHSPEVQTVIWISLPNGLDLPIA